MRKKNRERSKRLARPRGVDAAVVAVGTVLGVASVAMALPPVVFPPANPYSESKRVLGKVLFWDEQLSSQNTVSCGSCHQPAFGGTDPNLARHPGDDNTLFTGDDILGSIGVIRADANRDFVRDPVFGVTAQFTGRAANSVINAALVPELFWDGRAAAEFRDPITNVVLIPNWGGLESQSVGPPVSSVEMGHSGIVWADLTTKLAGVNPLDLATNIPPDVAAVLASRPSYGDLFSAAFGDSQITPARVAMAIATYERTQISDQAPLERFRAGETTALTAAEQRGLTVFTSNASRCSVCHSATIGTFTDTTFRNIGLRPPSEDPGRQTITGLIADRGKFKVPGLRNVALKRSFMHNGMFSTLEEVVAFYARSASAPAQFPDNRDPIMTNINLTQGQQDDLVAFMRGALTDPRVRDETFPFDRPTLVRDRAANMPVLVGGGAAGAGGVPVMIAADPPMVGNSGFRFGVDGVPAGALARLGLSANPPVGGSITPDRYLGAVNANSTGTATAHWPLTNGVVSAGQVLYAQWFVVDPAAAGGESRSGVARVTFFCGLYGCPPACPGDYTHDGQVDGDDVIAFFGDWDAGNPGADMTGDGGVDGDDVIAFFGRWDSGC